jgi:hypothetical protein
MAMTENGAKRRQVSGHTPVVARRSGSQQKEDSMTTKCIWPGVLTVVLGAALANPVAAQVVRTAGPIVLTGSFVAQIVEAIAAAVFIALVFIHELSVILGLCSLASPLSPAIGRSK